MEVEHTSGGAELLSDLGTVVRPPNNTLFSETFNCQPNS